MHWVYVAWDSSGICLYVGRTSTSRPWRRMFEHAKRSDWYNVADQIELHEFATREDMRNAEDEMWHDLHPLWNDRRPGRANDKPVEQHGWARYQRDECGRFHQVSSVRR